MSEQLTVKDTKQLIKLLRKWEAIVVPRDAEQIPQLESQPLYGEVIRLIIRQLEREIAE